MKILVFTTLYPNNVWPTQGVFVKERMTAVARLKGYELRVVAPVPYYPPIKFGARAAFNKVVREEVIEGVQVYHPRYLMIPKVGMLLHGLMMFLSLWIFVKKVKREFDFDLIDAHYVYPDGFAGVLLGATQHRPVVITARGSDINQSLDFYLVGRLVKYALQKADRLITVCAALRDAIVRCGVKQSKITVVANGVDVEKFYPIPTDVARQSVLLPHDRKIILSVGSLIPRKGFDLLIRTLAKAKESSSGVGPYLVIVGSGPELTPLQHLAKTLGVEAEVHFVGQVPHEQLRVWYAAADLFCLASSKEGWPNVILESLACGTPVVAASIWGVPEIIKSNEIGLLCNRDVDSLAAALGTALGRTWDRKLIRHYAQQHTWNHVARSVTCVFESVKPEYNPAVTEPVPSK